MTLPAIGRGESPTNTGSSRRSPIPRFASRCAPTTTVADDHALRRERSLQKGTRVWARSHVRRVYFLPLVRTKVAVAALMLVLTTVFGGASAASDARPVGNSLVPVPGGWGASAVVLGGGTVTYGMQVLTLAKGASPVKVTGVHLVHAKGMTLIGTRLAGPHRRTYQFISTAGFPPKNKRKSVPAIGATITPPKRGWEMLIGLRVAATGRAVIRGVRVTYRTVRHRKVEQQTLHGTFLVCTAKSQLDSDGTCSPRARSER